MSYFREGGFTVNVDLEGKVAIVTGAGTGMGESHALALAKAGADIVVADIDLELAEKVAGEVESMGCRALAVKVDVSNSEEVKQLVKKTLDAFQKIDILINNAGIDRLYPAEELPEAEWDAMINVNLKGTFLCSQEVGRQMIKQKSGKIINIASTAANRGYQRQAAYSASKGGVLVLTKALAVEWAKYNINVNSVSPGTTMTPLFMAQGINVDGRIKRTPLGRLNKPENISDAVLFLASPASDNITGQDILVDGGVAALYWPAGE